MHKINLIFAQALKSIRTSRKLTQEELAHLSGIDYKYLQKLEGNKPSSPTLETLEKLSRGLNISLVELVSSIVTRQE